MLTVVLFAATVVLLIAVAVSKLLHRYRKLEDIPSVSPRWPIVGNMFDFSKTHIILTQWFKQYGPVFRINIYGEEILVLNDFHSIYDALVTKGSAVAGRPTMYRTAHADRNKNSIVWQSYTPTLQFLRKTVHKSLKMYGGGLDRLQDGCSQEIDELMTRIKRADQTPIDPWDLFYDAACNIMLHLVLGFHLPHESPEFGRLKEINRLFNHTFGPGSGRSLDVLPWLKLFRNDDFSTLQEALQLRNSFWNDYGHGKDARSVRSSCVVSSLSQCSKESGNSEMTVTEEMMKETFTNLILAGTDTTTTALTCFLLVLLHHPQVQNKLHQELDCVIGSRQPSLDDRRAMPYMEAALLETLRFISHVPLAVPHATVCDTVIAGKRIPKDTSVYINLWAMHHDETFWKDPWSFNPDRFLDDSGKLLPSHHPVRKRVMAFGAGRRVCLGETLAKNRLFLFAASLLQRFAFHPEDENRIPELDPRSYTLGIVLHPQRFKVRAVERR